MPIEAEKNNLGPVFPGSEQPGFAMYGMHEEESQKLSLSTPDRDAIVAGKKGLYIVGCMSYTDADGAERHTDFCYYLHHLEGQPDGSFGSCGRGNYTE